MPTENQLINIEDLVAGLIPIKRYIDSISPSHDSTKADKVANATANNFAKLDANGNLADSGISISEFNNISGGGATVDVFTGASSSTNGTSGIVPAPQMGDQQKVLYGDGTWKTLTSEYTLPTASSTVKGGIKVGSGLSMNGETLNTAINEATTSQSGLMSSSDKIKLDGLDNYTLPPASASTRGGIKPGTGCSMTDDVLNVTIGGGTTYSVATTSQDGLMSATDKSRLDTLFQSTSDVIDTVLAGIGSKFVPSASNVADFITRDDQIRFFDNRLYKITNTTSGFYDPLSNKGGLAYWGFFQFDNFLVSIEYTWDSNDNQKYYLLCEETNSTVTVANDNATLSNDLGMYFLSETVGLIYNQPTQYNSSTGDSKRYTTYIRPFTVTSAGKLALGTNNTLFSASSWFGDTYIYSVSSIFDPNHYMFYAEVETSVSSGGYTYWNYIPYFTTIAFDSKSTNSARVQGTTKLGTIYSSSWSAAATETSAQYIFTTPGITIEGNNVTVGVSTNRMQPMLYVEEKKYNSSRSLLSTTYTLYVHHGLYRTAPAKITTFDDGWLEDDNNLLLGIYRENSGSTCYAITFKKGTYNYSSSFWDDIATVWTFDFLTPRLVKTNYKFSNILPFLDLG